MPRLTPERIADLRAILDVATREGRSVQLTLIDYADLLSDLAEQTERAEKAELARDRAFRTLIDAGDKCERLYELLSDINSLESEAHAIGGGPGFAERKSAIMRRVAEEFEP